MMAAIPINSVRAEPAHAMPPAARPRSRSVGVLVSLLTLVVLILVPVCALVVPAGHPLHLSDYALTLLGKILCYGVAALALGLVWGYSGILSLGHALFFALGGYAFGMYLMRESAGDGLPAFM